MKKTILALSLLSVCLAAAAQNSIPDSTDVFFGHLQINEAVVTGLAGDAKMKEMPAPVSVPPTCPPAPAATSSAPLPKSPA